MRQYLPPLQLVVFLQYQFLDFLEEKKGKVLKVLTKNKNLPEERKLVLKNIYNPSSNDIIRCMFNMLDA